MDTGRSAGRWPPELVGVLVLAVALRLPGLLRFDLWQDEIYSIYEAKYLYDSPIGPGGMELRALYFWLLHPLADAMPHATTLLRLPSLLFGLAGIVATWALTRRLLGRAPAFVAAVMLTILPLHIDASQIIRWIAFAVLVGALMSDAMLRALRSDATSDHLRTFAWVTIGSLTHVTFLMPALGLAMGAHLIRDDGSPGLRWPTRRAWRSCWLPYLLGMSAYYAVLALLFSRERLMGEAAGSAGRLLPALAFYLTPSLVTAMLIGMTWLLRQRDAERRRLALMAGGVLIVPTVVMILGNLLGTAAVSVVYYSGGLAVLLATAAASVRALGGDGPATWHRTAIVTLLLAAAIAPSTASHLMDGSRFDFREPLRRIQSRDPGGTVVLYPVIHARWEAPELDAVELRPQATTAFLDSIASTRPRFWTIAALRRNGMGGDAGGAKLAWLYRRCTLVHRQGRPRVDYEQYETLLFECPGDPPAEGRP